MKDTCYICGKPEDYRMDGRIVRECRDCEELTCNDCAEVDFDSVGDPPHFVCCQWNCLNCIKRRYALVPYDPRFHVFDWTTVADAAQQALMNMLRKVNAQYEATLRDVRRANHLLNSVLN